MIVHSLHIYPLKSARGIDLSKADIAPAGLAGDRQFMLIDAQARFLTQREHPDLAKITVHTGADAISLSYDGSPESCIALPDGTKRETVQVWRAQVDAALCDDAANAQLSEWLGEPVRLVMFDGQSARSANPDWTGQVAPIRFSDGYPILITTTASLRALNDDLTKKGGTPVPMSRFRPNLVIEHDTPWMEDYWAALDIAGIRFDLVKPCQRCVVTTQDQTTGATGLGDPMPAMKRLRVSADIRVKGVLFGWNTVPRGCGVINLGDRVKVIEDRPDGWPLRQH
ncbi:MOSC domain-containing protein [Parvularcula sp. IMCC14364]|uniref:MOSC domain-containing protein n=1 Tax=Parvularcula sp. IMCC14364 TaxID=3067902 RepID=UPI002740F560|nr:MOSC N-terminal beta barrel domain-containing protein [Parvularcula sp. IMCC14364]